MSSASDPVPASATALSDSSLARIFAEARTIAVVGLKTGANEVSYRIAEYLHRQGYRIVPVSPRLDAAFGVASVPDLLAITEPIDIVDVFRASSHIPAHADEALRMHHRPRLFWMQSGVTCATAAERLRRGAIDVVEDRCLMVEHARLASPTRS